MSKLETIVADYDPNEHEQDECNGTEPKHFKYKFLRDFPELGVVKDKVYEILYVDPEWDPDCMDEMVEYFMRCMRQKYGRGFHLFYDMCDDRPELWNDIEEGKAYAKHWAAGRLMNEHCGSKYNLAAGEVDHSGNSVAMNYDIVWLNPAHSVMTDEEIAELQELEDIDVSAVDMSDINLEDEKPKTPKEKLADLFEKMKESGTKFVTSDGKELDADDLASGFKKLADELEEFGEPGFDPDFRM